MLTRCYKADHPTYKSHGARGIRVCPEWLTDFRQFHADMGLAPFGLTLDRRDNDGDYTKENCRWATYSQQNANQRKRKKADA